MLPTGRYAVQSYGYGKRSMCVAWDGGAVMSGCEITEPRLRCVMPFEAAPAEVRLLRRAAARQLSRWGVPDAADEADLLVTELATNVLKHVGEGVSASLVLEWRGERLRLEVHDGSREIPELRTAGCDEECGRGLHLLSALAADWGTVLTAVGKAVWCEIPLHAGRLCGRIERAVAALRNYSGDSAGFHARKRPADLEESAVGLIADLLCWTAARGHDPDKILVQAQLRYEAEAVAV